jgi:UDP-N-acetyl-D-mannosaminuronate dehydrogenase
MSAVPHQRKIAVIGLGYVGLPVAVAFARSGAGVVGFDIDRNRIEELKKEGGIVLDVKSRLDRAARPDGVELWRL